MHAELKRMMDNALAKLRLPFRATIARTNGKPDNQLTQITGLAGEPLDGVEMAQQFGLTSHPPAGSAAIVLPLGGKTGHAVIIATENGQHRTRQLAEGETALYNAHGATIILKADGQIEITCKTLTITATEAVQITTPAATIQGNLHVTGGIVADGDVADAGGDKTMAGMRDTFNEHSRHPPQPRM